MPDRSSFELGRALRNLADFIERQNHQKGLEHFAPILLVDLCSIPQGITDKTVSEMLEFLTRFFICNLKDAQEFEFAVCVCENSKVRGDDFEEWYRAFCGNIFPDNCSHYTARFDNRYGKYFGITEQDIMSLVKETHMNIDERALQLLLQLNTFSVRGEKLFYPTQVFDYLNDCFAIRTSILALRQVSRYSKCLFKYLSEELRVEVAKFAAESNLLDEDTKKRIAYNARD